MQPQTGSNLRPLLTVDTHGDAAADWPYWPVAAVLGVIWLVFAWPWLSGAFTIPWDAKAHFAPQVQFMAASFARGELPLWNPFAFAGHPQIADPQSMIFSPPMLALALANPAPSLWAIDTVTLGMLLVAGLGALWLARDLGWHWTGALVAAIGFAFGAAMAWRLQHFGQVFSLAYFPFALVFLRRALAGSSIVYGALAGLVGAFIVLGRDQVALLVVYLLVAYAAWHVLCDGPRLSRFWRALAPLTATATVGLALVVLPILMTVHLATMSNRPFIDYDGAAAGSLHPALLVTAAIPHLFGSAGEMAKFWGPPSFTWEDTGLFIAQNMGIVYLGAVSYVLLAIGSVRGFFFDRGTIRFLVVAFVAILLYALGWYTPFFRLAYQTLPGVDLYRRPADAVFVLGGLGALLAGYAAHRLFVGISNTMSLWQWSALAVAVTLPFALALVFARIFDRLEPAMMPLAVAVAWFAMAGGAIAAALWLKPIRPVLSGLCIALPLGADLAVNNGPNGASALPAEAIAMLEPNHPVSVVRRLKNEIARTRNDRMRPRIELAGLGFHWPNASLSHRLEHTLGYNPVRLKYYSAAVGAGDTIGLPDQRVFTPLFPSYRSLLANLLGLRFIASRVPIEKVDKTLKPGDFPVVARTPQAVIYENRASLPRVMFVTAARRADFAHIVKTGNWPGGFDPTGTVLLDENVPLTLRRAAGTARIEAYRNNTVEITARSPAGGWLVLNDVWHPWWSATVSGKPARVYRANVLFRAVRVPPGRHVVRFTFRPVAGLLADYIDRNQP